jgi:hypothetical protein
MSAEGWLIKPTDEVLLEAPGAPRRLHRTWATVVKVLRRRVRVRAEADGEIYVVPRAAIVALHPINSSLRIEPRDPAPNT